MSLSVMLNTAKTFSKTRQSGSGTALSWAIVSESAHILNEAAILPGDYAQDIDIKPIDAVA